MTSASLGSVHWNLSRKTTWTNMKVDYQENRCQSCKNQTLSSHHFIRSLQLFSKFIGAVHVLFSSPRFRLEHQRPLMAGLLSGKGLVGFYNETVLTAGESTPYVMCPGDTAYCIMQSSEWVIIVIYADWIYEVCTPPPRQPTANSTKNTQECWSNDTGGWTERFCGSYFLKADI